ncbi:uncharacterized protein LOC115631918 [Scaptodrosophila lebanonensis]|uniref:Uncharacterized protein LOC115631918 n=1 Tax=Drosophila lebanonensis TaxID=7225 RepID=A0A6J2U9F2_DROLE|nr:uncharacterized protein LOC115631918 [Scaptodrosophila lebanonensis]
MSKYKYIVFVSILSLVMHSANAATTPVNDSNAQNTTIVCENGKNCTMPVENVESCAPCQELIQSENQKLRIELTNGEQKIQEQILEIKRLNSKISEQLVTAQIYLIELATKEADENGDPTSENKDLLESLIRLRKAHDKALHNGEEYDDVDADADYDTLIRMYGESQ